ncbi:hypothetical protein AURDEDRAFT_152710 [Auricularia subglabra TFB-10046 SS5]|nr:hypothetical protein AURDEDRAFT_152710 [Auricularia subglabra TFB-10046 SS5]
MCSHSCSTRDQMELTVTELPEVCPSVRTSPAGTAEASARQAISLDDLKLASLGCIEVSMPSNSSQLISLKVATFTCGFLESVAYGVAAVLFVNSVLTLLRARRSRDRINVPLIVFAPLIFFFATLHIFAVWARTYIGFVSYAEGPDKYLGLITTPEKTLAQVGQLGAISLADGMTVYRAWMIWERRLVLVVIPVLTFIATLVLVVWKLAAVQWQLRSSYDPAPKHAGMVASSAQSLASRVIRIVVESAALYSVVNLLYCVLYAAALNSEAWFSTLDAPVASITFSLIIIRTETAAQPNAACTTTGGPQSWNPRMDAISPGEKHPHAKEWPEIESSSSTTVVSNPKTETVVVARVEAVGDAC